MCGRRPRVIRYLPSLETVSVHRWWLSPTPYDLSYKYWQGHSLYTLEREFPYRLLSFEETAAIEILIFFISFIDLNRFLFDKWTRLRNIRTAMCKCRCWTRKLHWIGAPLLAKFFLFLRALSLIWVWIWQCLLYWQNVIRAILLLLLLLSVISV